MGDVCAKGCDQGVCHHCCVWQNHRPPRYRQHEDTVNVRAVRILLECLLVFRTSLHSSRMRTARPLTVFPDGGGGGGCLLGGGGGLHSWGTPPNKVEQTNECENIIFARFATRAVKIILLRFQLRRRCSRNYLSGKRRVVDLYSYRYSKMFGQAADVRFDTTHNRFDFFTTLQSILLNDCLFKIT